MLRTAIDNSLLIAESMALLQRGHPEALPEVQRQMRLINQSYPDPTVLRCTDEVVRQATLLHGPPDGGPEEEHRARLRAAVERLRDHLETLPDPSPRGVRSKAR